jgi:hypothetical protein
MYLYALVIKNIKELVVGAEVVPERSCLYSLLCNKEHKEIFFKLLKYSKTCQIGCNQGN